jgi:tetratricopeptide (TPR) repeat protein
VRLDPGDAGSWRLLADLLHERGDYDGALAAARSAERAAASDLEDLVEARRRIAYALVAKGEPEEAHRVLVRGLDGSEAMTALAPTRGRLLVYLGRTEEAASVLEEAASQFEDSRRFFLVRGLVRALGGDPEAARGDFERARDFDPIRTFWPTVGIAFADRLAGRKDAAFEAIGEAVLRRPKEAYGHYLLGRFHLASGNEEQALAELEQAHRASPEVTEILGDLGFVHLRLGDPSKASAYFSELVERRPDSAEAHELLGVALLGQGRSERAREEIVRAIELHREASEESPQALLALAWLDYRSGDEDGVFRAMGGLMRVTELLEGRIGDPLLGYAATYLAAIEDNRSKCSWVDGFNRLQVRRGWETEQSHGVQVRLTEGGVRFEGTQRTRNEELTYIERPMEFREVVRHEATLSGVTGDKVRVGISIALRATRGDREVTGGIFFGREPRGRVAYQVVERGKPRPWEVLDARWPDEGTVTLAIESQDPEEGLFRLLVNGEEAASGVDVPALRKPRNPPRVGIFGTAPLGATWTLVADDVQVLLKKEEGER